MGGRWVIGLTGDVGGGKSAVRGWLEGRGAATLDADAVVHGLLEQDAGIAAAVERRFGPQVRSPGGGVDRAALAARVFDNPAALADLEAILHPPVRARTRAWLAAAAADVAVVEAVKLIEAGMREDVDAVWLVLCDRAERAARLVTRGWSPGEAVRRIAAGGPLLPRLAVADVVIDNSGPWPATVAQLAAAWDRRPGAGEAKRPAGGLAGGGHARMG